MYYNVIFDVIDGPILYSSKNYIEKQLFGLTRVYCISGGGGWVTFSHLAGKCQMNIQNALEYTANVKKNIIQGSCMGTPLTPSLGGLLKMLLHGSGSWPHFTNRSYSVSILSFLSFVCLHSFSAFHFTLTTLGFLTNGKIMYILFPSNHTPELSITICTFLSSSVSEIGP